MPTQVIKTTKREPLYEDADGRLYQQLTHAEGMRDLDSIREIVNVKSGEQETTVRWLKPFGHVCGTKAEAEDYAAIAERQSKAKQPAGEQAANGSKAADPAAAAVSADTKAPAKEQAAKTAGKK